MLSGISDSSYSNVFTAPEHFTIPSEHSSSVFEYRSEGAPLVILSPIPFRSSSYYDTALSVKYARDEQVQQMLALVRQSASTSIDFIYSAIFNTNDLIDTAWRGKELASWHASMQSSINARLYEYLDIDIDG